MTEGIYYTVHANHDTSMKARTITGDGSSDTSQPRLQTPMETPHPQKRIIASLSWHIGRFKLLTGIATLGAATAILAVSNKRARGAGTDVSLRIVPLILAAFSLFFFNSRPRRVKTNEDA